MKLILLASLSWWPIAIARCLIVAAALLAPCAPRGPHAAATSRAGWRLLSTNAWFRDCGYDLRHLPVGENGLVRCPECAACSAAAAIARPHAAVCPWRGSASPSSFSRRSLVAYSVRSGNCDRQLSDTTLIPQHRRRSAADALGAAIRVAESHQRQPADPFAAADLQETVSLVIDELHNDDISGNAEEAVTALEGPLWAYSNRALYEALGSTDWQQRQIVANLLVRRGDAPSPDLLRVLVEALRDDTLPSGVGFEVQLHPRLQRRGRRGLPHGPTPPKPSPSSPMHSTRPIGSSDSLPPSSSARGTASGLADRAVRSSSSTSTATPSPRMPRAASSVLWGSTASASRTLIPRRRVPIRSVPLSPAWSAAGSPPTPPGTPSARPPRTAHWRRPRRRNPTRRSPRWGMSLSCRRTICTCPGGVEVGGNAQV